MNFAEEQPLTFYLQIHKCRHPLAVSVGGSTFDFKWEREYVGNQTATIGDIPEFIGKIAGQPYIHLEIIRTASGVLMSEGLWIKKDGKWIQRIPLLTRVSIPLDTTDCPTGNCHTAHKYYT